MNINHNYITYSLSHIQSDSPTTGSIGVDPLDFTFTCFVFLLLWISYLLIPKGLRVQYFGAYPKQYAWSERMKRRRQFWTHGINTYKNYHGKAVTENTYSNSRYMVKKKPSGFIHNSKPIFKNQDIYSGKVDHSKEEVLERSNDLYEKNDTVGSFQCQTPTNTEIIQAVDEIVDFDFEKSVTSLSTSCNNSLVNEQNIQLKDSNCKSAKGSSVDTHVPHFTSSASTLNEEIVISSTMQRLRDTGILVIAHGSRGKPKTVRVQLDENAIMWHSEGKKRKSNKQPKEHRVPLSHIMYVDVGKQTIALRRVENASVPDSVCLSLLTREGSLDLEVGNTGERDALVGCFSLVLDEVHARNWRDVYRAPSSDLPSSFDEFDVNGEDGLGIKTEKNVFLWDDKSYI